ncbi:MAG: hypothetical protein IKB38_01075 [Clostridia bacterium]|nr:hypothetical protein [Clostridia bacterium]
MEADIVSGESGFDFPTENGENLKRLSLEGSILSERRICELAEIADIAARFASELSESGLGIYEILSLVGADVSLSEDVCHEDAMEENLGRLRVVGELSDTADRIVFSDLLTERLASSGIALSERSFLPTEARDETFAYVKNAYSDEAYDVFSQEFREPRLRYVQSFKDAVRLVLEKEVSYALLPLEEAGGTRLPTVSALIYENDLKISALTPVFGPDGASELKYALVSESLHIPPSSADDDRYLEIRLSAGRGEELFGAMIAAKMFGVGIYRVNTVSFSSSEQTESFFTVIFKGEGCDFTRLLVYLTLFTEDFDPVGMYKNLE